MRRSILLVDDHPVVIFGLQLLFQDDARIEVCGSANNVDTALMLTRTLQPDLAILDLVLGGRDGLELLKNMIADAPLLKVLVYSSQSERLFAKKCMIAGAWGYLPKSESLPTVGRAIAAIAKGQRSFRTLDEEAARIVANPGEEWARTFSRLSNRELQVLRMIGAGHSTRDISTELSLSVKTIGTYTDRMKSKLELSTFRELEDVARDFVAGIF